MERLSSVPKSYLAEDLSLAQAAQDFKSLQVSSAQKVGSDKIEKMMAVQPSI
jgi:hypothetical protein